MWSRQSIQSYQGSISNSSDHNNVSVDDDDSLRLSREELTSRVSRNFSVSTSSDRDSSVSDHKSIYSLSKSAFHHRNQSRSTISTSLGDGSDTYSTAPSTRSPSPTPVYGLAPRPSNGSSTKAHDESLPPDRIDSAPRSHSGTATAKGKKGMLGFMTDLLNSNKWPEISTPYDPDHFNRAGFNSPTGEFTGLLNSWKLPDSGISQSDQEENPPAAMETVKFNQEGSGDVWDKMGHASTPGRSQSPHFPGTAQPAYPVLTKSVDDSFIPTVSGFLCHFP
jgi:hypothetical protein